MKDLKYEHQSNFPCGGESNLILGIGREDQIFFLRTPAAVKFFPQNCQKMTFWCKKTSYPPRCIFITHIGSPTLFPGGIIIFQGLLTKLNFFDEISRSGKICRFNEGPKI